MHDPSLDRPTTDTPPPTVCDDVARESIAQIFRDDTRARWQRVRATGALVVALLVAVAVLFLRSLGGPAQAISTHVVTASKLDEVRARAARAGIAAAPRPTTLDDVAPELLDATPVVGPGHVARFARRIGFLDPTELAGLRVLEAKASSLTDVAVVGLHLDGHGGLESVLPADAIERVHRSGARLLEVVDDVRDDEAHPQDVDALAADPRRLAAFAGTLEARLEADGADGAILDFDDERTGEPERAAHLAVFDAVAGALHARGRSLGVAFDCRFDPDALRLAATTADLVVVRAYEDLGPTSEPAPLASGTLVESTVEVARALVPADKLVLVLATRSAAWPVRSVDLRQVGPARSVEWTELVAEARLADVVPRWADGNLVVALPGERGIESSPLVRATASDSRDLVTVAWMVDGATFAEGLRLAAAAGVTGVGLGRLGGEDTRVWSLLQTDPGDVDAVRAVLETVPANDDWDVVGEGIELRVFRDERVGRATIDVDDGGRISERYDALPTAVTIVRRAPVPERDVVLTFDDGPDPTWTPQILDILREEDVRATFFLVGARVERDPELVRRLVAEGHELGNHSFSHADLGTIDPATARLEISATNRLFESVAGRSTALFRPPFRSDDAPTDPKDLLAIAVGAEAGLVTIGSTVDPHDWARPGPDAILADVLARVDREQGGVILLHDGGGDRSGTVAALRPMIRALRARGHSFVQVHQLLGDGAVSTVNPSVPRDALDRVSAAVWSSGTWLLRAMRAFALFALVLGVVRYAMLIVLAALERRRERRACHEERGPDGDGVRRAVSVVIPAYNEAAVIERTVRSVLASQRVDVEILVVDDGSTDATAAIVERELGGDPRVRLIRLSNGGKARALNVGFRRASYERVVALDADTIFLPGTIDALVRDLGDPTVAAVAGRAVVGNPRSTIARWQSLEYVVGQAVERRAWHRLGIVSVVPGAIGAWRRSAVLDAGGFGRETLAEDTDLTLALQARGHRVTYAPEAIALTEAPESVRALLKQRFRWSFGVLQAAWKHRATVLSSRPSSRRLGWLLLPTVLLTHLATPLLAPVADAAALTAIGLGHGASVLPYVLALFVAELLLTVYGLVLDGGRARELRDWPVQRAVYRWLLFVALVRAVVAAVRGGAVGWNKLHRTGSVRVPAETVA